jgi:NAD+ synthase
MGNSLKIALAQLNPMVGSIEGNLRLARKARAQARNLSADLILFSELYISGYPPEDLVLKPAFVSACMSAVETLATDTADGGPAVLIGTPWREREAVYNAVVLLDQGQVQTQRYKHELPNYGVFDEKRVFAVGPAPGPINFRGVRVGAPICEDIWTEDVCETLVETGAELLLVPNGSPFEKDKDDVRLNIAVGRVTETGLPLVYLNQIGGQDELVFDGRSFALNADRSLALQMPAFEECVTVTEWTRGNAGWRMIPQAPARVPEGEEAIWLACVNGLRDYVLKNRFPGVVLGLSGGIDSAVVAALAVDALGAGKVHCLMLPFRYTSPESVEDATQCAKALGVRYDVVPIFPAADGFSTTLEKIFAGTQSGVTEENLQSRVRGTTLIAVSNKFGSLVLTTGNKSEMSVGYATLYGDMNGGFNPIKDVYKTEVYGLAKFRNSFRPKGCLGPEGILIPSRIFTKAPSAELRPNQTDQDSLPPYPVLDDIIEELVEHERSVEDIVAKGYDKAVVERVQNLLYLAEYKRRQAPPGVKITRRNFGRDRRYPITNGFREKV